MYLSNISTIARFGTTIVFVLIVLGWFYVVALIILGGAIVNALRVGRTVPVVPDAIAAEAARSRRTPPTADAEDEAVPEDPPAPARGRPAATRQYGETSPARMSSSSGAVRSSSLSSAGLSLGRATTVGSGSWSSMRSQISSKRLVSLSSFTPRSYASG